MDWELRSGDELDPGRWIQQLLGEGERYQALLTRNDDLLCPTVVKILRPDQVDNPAARRTIAQRSA